jgi:hypothetical protein
MQLHGGGGDRRVDSVSYLGPYFYIDNSEEALFIGKILITTNAYTTSQLFMLFRPMVYLRTLDILFQSIMAYSNVLCLIQ